MNKIDVLIPVIEKDLEVLPHTVDGARENISHTIGEVFVIAPESTKIKDLCLEKKCRLINENTLLPITKEGGERIGPQL